MRNITLALFATMFSILFTNLEAQKIDFTEIKSEADWLGVLARAEKLDKPVFLDIYATWCGPCKQMDNLVFVNPEVADFYNKSFINSKIDGETEFGRVLVQELALTGYPTMFYLTHDKFMYSKLVGFRQPPAFLEYGTKIDANKGRLREFATSFEQGTLAGEKVKEYLDLLTELDVKDKLADLAALYINTLTIEDISNPDNKGLILNSNLSFESETFRHILQNPNEYSTLWGEEEYQNFLEKVYMEGLHRAANNEDIGLRNRLGEELMAVYFRSDPEAVVYGKFLTRKLYHAIQENWDSYIVEVDSYFKNEKAGDIEFLTQEVYQVLRNQYSSVSLLNACSNWVNIILEAKPSFEPYYLGSIIKAYLSDVEGAKLMLAEAEKLGTAEEKESLKGIWDYIGNIDQKEE